MLQQLKDPCYFNETRFIMLPGCLDFFLWCDWWVAAGFVISTEALSRAQTQTFGLKGVGFKV